MSSGVSDQMKVPGNSAKNVEERNIPWSQQVDEAYENLASPTTDDNSAANQSSMQFQYPPFNAKENQNFPSNNYNKPRKSSNNYEPNKKYGGKPAFYNNDKRDDFQPNTWGTHNTRKQISDNPPGNFNRSNRPDDGYVSGKLDNRPSGNASTEEKKFNAPPSTAAAAAAKKTTWASIASQPAKLTSRTTLTTSSHKKKGPGMPPPPMVPGKHNLDVNTWDLPNNNPPLIPSPPLPIEIAYTVAPAASVSTDVNPDYAAAEIVPEHPDHLGARLERGGGQGKGPTIDSPMDDNNKSTNYNNSTFGRVRNSPNGHSRKNWSMQHPLHPTRPSGGSGGGGGSSGITAGPMRRGDNNAGGGGPNRYTDRNRSNYVGSRLDADSGAYDFRDENSSRSAATSTAAAEKTSSSSVNELPAESPQAVLDELRDKNNYNPAEIDLEKAALARFFVIKSYSEDDIHRSIKYEIWCSTDHGNKRLDDAFKERHKEGGNILLFFSVNGSGHFCGMAQMMTAVDYNSTSSVWSQDKWKGKFKVKWIYVKDVPNTKLRHIRLENNDGKSVTNSRDTQEVPNANGVEVLQILHAYKHSTSIFDDFYHYEKKQEEEVSSKKPLGAHDPPLCSGQHQQTQSPVSRHYNTRQNNDDRDRDRDVRSIGPQKYFGGNSSGSSFRDRNNVQRGAYHNNYNDHRRFESHRTAGGAGNSDRDADTANRENSEYGSRHAQKFDYNRRDERTQQSSKQNNQERDFSEEHISSSGGGFRTGQREMQKDNEYPNADRNRGTDY